MRITVSGYELLSRLGEGGMGVVHLARQPGGDRVALKVLRPHIVGDDEARARLAREVNSLSRVRSPWVAEIVDADPWADIPFVATRYVPGLSLHDHVVQEGPLTGADLHWFAHGLAEGLAAVHAAGVLHRDIKPTNVLMEGRNPILIDFGLARVADDPKITHAGWLLGTPGYLAPEILHGADATAAADVHSWASTVAYAATGRSPFGRGPSMAIMDRVRRGEHTLPDDLSAGLPVDLRGILADSLDPDPARRPSLDRLRGWLGSPGAAQQPGQQPGQWQGRSRGPAPEPEYTMPISLAEPDQEWIGARDTVRLPTEPAGFAGAAGPTGPTRPMEPATRAYWDDGVPAPPSPWTELGPEPAVRVAPAERFRRGLLLVGLAVVAGAGIAAYPWLATVSLLLGTWLLRSGSLAATAAGERRRLRGRRWYDGAQLLVAAPWHLVRSIPSTTVLALWSVGLAIAAALLCYAVSAGIGISLFVCGLTFAASLWLGPGGSQVRSPLARVVNPLARTARSTVAGLLVLLVLAALAGYRVDLAGVSWAPAQRAPWHSVTTPSLPLG